MPIIPPAVTPKSLTEHHASDESDNKEYVEDERRKQVLGEHPDDNMHAAVDDHEETDSR